VALSSSALSSDIKTAFIAAFGSPADSGKLQQFCDAVANAVVTRIKTDAVVTATLLSNCQVTSGSGSGGLVTGGATGTIS
jgi:hypothetical protein